MAIFDLSGLTMNPTEVDDVSKAIFELVIKRKGDTDAKPQDKSPRFVPTDFFESTICGRTRHRRSLVANGFG